MLQSYLCNTEEARVVAGGKLTVIGAITRTLSLDKALKSGRPYSIQPICSEVANQVLCYGNLICFLRPGRICIYNTRGACEYDINIREIETLADLTDQMDENDEEAPVVLCDFNYHKLVMAFARTRRFVCIELKGDGSWEIIYVSPESIPVPHVWSKISSTGLVLYVVMPTVLRFEWFDFERRRTFMFDLDGRQGPDTIVDVVSSGSNVYILLSIDNFFETGMLRIAESRLVYEPKDKYLIFPSICADGKGGITVLTPTFVDNSLILQPNDDEPGFPQLSRAYFRLCDTYDLHYIGVADSTGPREIGRVRIAIKVRIVYTSGDMSRNYGSLLFFANFDARCERWTALRGQQIGRFYYH